MRRCFVHLPWMFFLLASSLANAHVIDNGDGTATDPERGLMWLIDSTLMRGVSQSQAAQWAADLVYAGYDDWRLPSALNPDGTVCSGLDCRDSELGHLFYVDLGNPPGSLVNPGPFIIDSVNASWFWTSTLGSSVCWWTTCVDTYWRFQFENGLQINDAYGVASNPLNAWAVRDIPSGPSILGLSGHLPPTPPPPPPLPVPAPASLWLLGLALGALAWRRRRPHRSNSATTGA